jgi:acetyl esterase/lipase
MKLARRSDGAGPGGQRASSSFEWNHGPDEGKATRVRLIRRRTTLSTLLTALTALVAVISFPASGASAKTAKRPVVLLFHPGGFVYPCGTPCMADEAVFARSYGFTPRVIDYPTWDVPGAMRAAIDAVPRHHRPTYAFGESAGGLLATRLAQTGRINAAAAESPVANLPFFVSSPEQGNYPIAAMLRVPSLRSQRLYSPASHSSRGPVFVTVAEQDDLTPSTLAWADKSRHDRVSAEIVPGDHLDSTGQLQPARLQLLFNWLACKAALNTCRRIAGGWV